jgi:long-chain acyl-CoA synthetase
VAVGAAPLPDELARAYIERCGCRIRQLYGMTENAGMGTSGRTSMPFRPGSAGIPYDKVEIQIHDDDGNALPQGQSGEIVTRGPCTMKGYLNLPEETAETLRGGWLHTGDIGYFDEDGWLFIVDRKKDMIIKGGENIFPAEVENVLYNHPDVAEAAVVGAPHPTYGEEVVAFVVPVGSAVLTEAEIIAHVKTEVSSFKAPSRVIFRTYLPKSGIGKILRRELRELVEESKETG